MRSPRPWFVPFAALTLPVTLFLAASWIQQPVASSQDAEPTGWSAVVSASENRWAFSELQYRPVGSTTVHRIPAIEIQKLWLVVRPDGGTILEILYDNADYKIAHATEVLFRSQSSTGQAEREVPVFRRPIGGMAFPTLD